MTVKIIKTGRIGRIVNTTDHDFAIMYEIAFEGQLWTECHWDSSVEVIGE